MPILPAMSRYTTAERLASEKKAASEVAEIRGRMISLRHAAQYRAELAKLRGDWADWVKYDSEARQWAKLGAQE